MTRFQSEKVVFKFLRCSLDGALVYFAQDHNVQASDFSFSIFRGMYWSFRYEFPCDLDYLFQSINIGFCT